MKTLHLSIITMGILVVSIISYLVFFAQPFTVKTDQDTYVSGKTITVYGNVGSIHDGINYVLIQIFYPDGSLYKSSRVSLIDTSDVYTNSFPTDQEGGIAGNYVVKVTYTNQTAKTMFNFIPIQPPSLREPSFID